MPHARSAARLARPRETRTAAAPARARGAARPDRVADQHPQSALALGLLQPRRPYLSELEVGDDAGAGEGLRADPRADAPEAHGSLAEVLEAGGCRVPRLSGRAALAAAAGPSVTTKDTKTTRDTKKKRLFRVFRGLHVFVCFVLRSRSRAPRGRSAG